MRNSTESNRKEEEGRREETIGRGQWEEQDETHAKEKAKE